MIICWQVQEEKLADIEKETCNAFISLFDYSI